LDDFKMPKWNKSRRNLEFFFSLNYNRDCKITVSWNRGGTIYLLFFSASNYKDSDYISILKDKFKEFRIVYK
jgi:hypothetical protein